MKTGIIINSRKNKKKYKKENEIIDYYMSQFNSKQKNLNTDY